MSAMELDCYPAINGGAACSPHTVYMQRAGIHTHPLMADEGEKSTYTRTYL